MTFPYKISLTKIQIASDARHHFVHDACRIELSCSDGAHRWLIDGLSLLNRVDEVIESNGGLVKAVELSVILPLAA